MRKPLSAFLVLLLMAVPLVAGVVAVVYAADLCLDLGGCHSGSVCVEANVVVKDVGGGSQGKSMNNDLAKPNKCQQRSGFTLDGLFGNVSLCTSSDATHVTAISNFLGVSIQTVIPLPIPTNPSSNALSDVLAPNGSFTGLPTTAGVCSPPNFPVFP